MLKFAKLFFIIAISLYLVVVLFVYIKQRSFQYFPQADKASKAYLVQNQIEVLPISVASIGIIDSYYRKAEVGKPLVLFLHGNASLAYDYLPYLMQITQNGGGFLAVEYPAYAGRPGKVTEKSILKTALAAYDSLIKMGISPQQIIVHGDSLGASAAVYIAANRDIGGLALSAPFYSMRAMARKQMPFFPTNILLKDTWRSDQWIKNVKAPLLIIHGDKDRLIPYSQSQDLIKLHEAKHGYKLIKNGQHFLWQTEMPKLVINFAYENARASK